jgi:hypothetical protein
MTDEILVKTPTMQDKVQELSLAYSKEIGAWCDDKVPPILGNADYAARTSALVIALTRELARAAAAYGEAQDQDSETVGGLILALFTKNHIQALETIEAARQVEKGETIQ